MKNLTKYFTYVKYFFISYYGYLTILIIFLVYLTFFDKNNFLDKWKLSGENSDKRTEINKLKKTVEQNQNQAELLRNNKTYLEQYARDSFNMKEENEDVFLFDE
ncbi:MAG: septum formation initiator family protein [Prevotellaceae bacterium]|jgi:cell division protein FtsB|nr:septum formation initiator family protein [Prevotellaceae bacterium]